MYGENQLNLSMFSKDNTKKSYSLSTETSVGNAECLSLFYNKPNYVFLGMVKLYEIYIETLCFGSFLLRTDEVG